MDIRTLLFASFTLTACSGLGGECPYESDFSIVDEALTEAEVQALLDASGASERSALSCEEFCTERQPAESIDIAACELSLDEEAGDSDEAVVGSLTCSGTGEYLCD